MTITDATAPKVTKVNRNVILKKDDSGEVDKVIAYVFFDEPVDATAINKANYGILDEEMKLTTISKDPAFYDSNKVVKLELTADEWKIIDEGVGLFIKNIKDLNGNEMAGYVVDTFDDYENDMPKIEKIEVVAKDKALVYYDQFLKRVDRQAFAVNGTTPAAIELSEKDGKTVVTMILGKDNTEFKADLEGATLSVVITDKYKLLNIFDVEAKEEIKKAANEDDMIDKIAPSVDKDSSTAKGNEITLVYDENIDFETVSKMTFEVADREVKAVSPGGNNEIKITVDGEAFEKDAKVKVTQKHAIRGEDGNESKFDTIELTAEASGESGESGGSDVEVEEN